MERFIADVHLGKLARMLRLLGFDVLYQNSYTQLELVAIALQEDRVLLSKNSLLPKRIPALRFLLIQSNDSFQQLDQVLHHLQTKDFQPFTRCLVCNGTLRSVIKEAIADQLQLDTAKYFEEFWQCENCKHIYWKGSHYNRMVRLVERLFH